MKKTILTLGACSLLAIAANLPVMANDDIFGEIDVKNYTEVKPPAAAEPALTSTLTPAVTKSADKNAEVIVPGANQMKKSEVMTTQNLQTSISNLESAQADLRSKLTTAQQNYATVDANYVRIKKEREALNKIVKQTTNRIKALEKTKKNIRKTMETAQ
ncbi:MAG: hypothetical protein PHX18_04760 [Candidatus Gastranaerophilales bacterium]|nr:hypothetical protein [Candidatus Gastranaerophilales bacterium]